jgi:DNA polymerase III delta prime subunit
VKYVLDEFKDINICCYYYVIMKDIPQTFISKYKPFRISDFQASPEFLSVLKALFVMDDLNLLFVGDANAGKTSFLYAVIREYYNIENNGAIPENNIMFINNLKEQGINFFRSEMKTFCRSHSSIYGKKKMIIIDDMDSINEQSQQVFRNYIDKYKRNVNFIFACSNTQKIIESIQSRVHILHIKSLNETQIRVIMDKIIENECIKISDDAKKFILKISDNAIRNVINNLEKIYIYGLNETECVSTDNCRQLCSNISLQQFETYIHSFANRDIYKSIQILYNIHDYGYSVIDILNYFFTFIKVTDLLSEMQKYKIIPVICKYITIFNKIHENVIELALFTNEISTIIIN